MEINLKQALPKSLGSSYSSHLRLHDLLDGDVKAYFAPWGFSSSFPNQALYIHKTHQQLLNTDYFTISDHGDFMDYLHNRYTTAERDRAKAIASKLWPRHAKQVKLVDRYPFSIVVYTAADIVSAISKYQYCRIMICVVLKAVKEMLKPDTSRTNSTGDWSAPHYGNESAASSMPAKTRQQHTDFSKGGEPNGRRTQYANSFMDKSASLESSEVSQDEARIKSGDIQRTSGQFQGKHLRSTNTHGKSVSSSSAGTLSEVIKGHEAPPSMGTTIKHDKPDRLPYLDEEVPKVLKMIKGHSKMTKTGLMSKLNISYARATKIMDQLEKYRFISGKLGKRMPRKVYYGHNDDSVYTPKITLQAYRTSDGIHEVHGKGSD